MHRSLSSIKIITNNQVIQEFIKIKIHNTLAKYVQNFKSKKNIANQAQKDCLEARNQQDNFF